MSVLGVLVVRGLTGSSGGSDGTAGAAPVATMEEEPSAAEATEEATEEATDEATVKASEKKERLSIPATGPGTFTTAGGESEPVGGDQRLLTYRVQVEDGIGRPADAVAAEVEKILADPRGWTADGKVGFRRVSGDSSDFRVRLATAATVDDICGQYGLDTGGEVNCRVGQDVMVNLKRWELATKYYADDVPSYRALIINHEVGHFLGHGHETCPGEGQLAPAMMQQIKGLHGCRTNVWPYDSEGRRITGPSVP
ncbi:DUF3152 domain-containing protein [Streptomyces sp. NPDC090994]|uniref:DUF3152 domain-containing protein n=1 Tax=Streptomyces sp. NPDC090994 TaxID=3365969 RepID=UPI00380B50B3